MKRTIFFTTALATAAGLFALGANAQQQHAPDQTRLSVAQIAIMLEEQGYSVVEVELEHGRYDVEMIDGKGMRVDAYLDPATGAVLPYREDDDGYRRNLDDDRRDRDED